MYEIRNHFIEIEYYVSNGLVILITNHRGVLNFGNMKVWMRSRICS